MNRKRYQESVMSFVPVAPGKIQSYVPPKQQSLSGRTERGRAGQLSGLYLLNRDIPQPKWMAESFLSSRVI